MTIKTEDSNFSRDEGNHALLNSNIEAYKMYRQQRNQQAETVSLQGQINDLKKEVSDIKGMLRVLIQRENNGTFNT
ncbi:MAG: hypothetical protein EBU08_02610 [Micrococcales bacterium]|nr:hypothetical protein [Micrococcales bacterium]